MLSRMKSLPKPTQPFIGRKSELSLIETISQTRPAILIIHGRRRIGKTSLVERAFRDETILKFEGIEGLSKKAQINAFLLQLTTYIEKFDSKNANLIKILISKISTKVGWFEILAILSEYVVNKKLVLFFEEFQWLASYDDELIGAPKYYWDNCFKDEKNILLVLCGSSPSFMVNHVVYSKALYNRSQYELPLQQFTIYEAKQFLGRRYSNQDVMDAYLLVGGIPEYLKYLTQDSSIYLSLAANSFTKGAFFKSECSKIFISSLSQNPNYQEIVKFLSKVKFASRDEILRHLKLESGSNTSRILDDLEISGIISKYTPYNKTAKTKLVRYEIADSYLQFFYKFVEPKIKMIDRGDFQQKPSDALPISSLDQWLGYSYERFCRNNAPLIAKILGFGAVSYTYGPYFNRASSKEDKNYQLDLVFDRKDKVVTVCEIKYTRSPISAKHAKEFLVKMDFFTPKGRTIQTVLICNQAPTDEVLNGRYFDQIITLDELIS